jgi:hypothetical protein
MNNSYRKNPKSELRNPKQIRNLKPEKLQTAVILRVAQDDSREGFFSFAFWSFEFVSDFGF